MVVSCVVEGHGEVDALPVLLRRLVPHMLPGGAVDVPRPNRQARSRLLRPGELERAVEFAALRVGDSAGGVLVVIDADNDCPAELGPALLARAQGSARGMRVAVVLASREYEAWFLSAASSLAGTAGLPEDLQDHPSPESPRDAKGWLDRQMPIGRAYSPTVDQPSLSAHLDLGRARARSESFDKLARSVYQLMTGDQEQTLEH